MSSSDSDYARRLPAAYRPKRRRDSSSSSKTYSDHSEDERRRERRRREPKKQNNRKKVKKDKPMWKEEGEISCESESESSLSSSRSRSRSRDRRRIRRRQEEWTERQRRIVTMPEHAFQCDECGCKHHTLKGLIHHQMNDHNLDAQCHLCQKKFETKKNLREHYELEHTQEVVKCVFCKSSFDQPLEMKDPNWDDFFSHIYGEILYSRLANYEERVLNR